ncbi:hypothetical protein EYF80_018812 [Liparis tanakae]|uniref:Uncharacterized protein n=1 Tax=Liparis tanakae TaxID=230148 RepID=A0A4Z2HYY0_9TELE|nr:hypothetical protein EYF80_018812 [Liparis tanakae]
MARRLNSVRLESVQLLCGSAVRSGSEPEAANYRAEITALTAGHEHPSSSTHVFQMYTQQHQLEQHTWSPYRTFWGEANAWMKQRCDLGCLPAPSDDKRLTLADLLWDACGAAMHNEGERTVG